jgi:hypothetical protein
LFSAFAEEKSIAIILEQYRAFLDQIRFIFETGGNIPVWPILSLS